jgi:hypothetical protein
MYSDHYKIYLRFTLIFTLTDKTLALFPFKKENIIGLFFVSLAKTD